MNRGLEASRWASLLDQALIQTKPDSPAPQTFPGGGYGANLWAMRRTTPGSRRER